MIDDGSFDNSFEVIKKLCLHDSRFRGIRLRENMGQHRAISIGLQYSSGRYILIMDDDMESSIEIFPRCWQKISEGWDVISGRRMHRSDIATGRLLAAKIINFGINRLSKRRFYDATSPFKLFRRDLIGELIQKGREHLLIPEYIMLKGQRIAEIPISVDHQIELRSRYDYKKLLLHTLMLARTLLAVFGSYKIDGLVKSMFFSKDIKNVK